jgi:hypothetical protein
MTVVLFPTGTGKFLLATESRLVLGPTQPLNKWIPETLSPEVKLLVVKLTSPCCADVKNTWSYNSTTPYVFMTWCLVGHRENFTFTFNSY